jgi:hypothetical protein
VLEGIVMFVVLKKSRGIVICEFEVERSGGGDGGKC